MKFGIIIASYRRPDGQTPRLLERALRSVVSQLHQDYFVLLIGDKYEDEEELKSVASIVPAEKIYLENLPYAAERERYPKGGHPLWASGGLNAMNRAIEVGLQVGITHFCHLDHDDYWSPDHLLNFQKKLSSEYFPFLVSYSTSSVFHSVLPVETDDSILPIPRGIIHSATCVDFYFFSERYRDVFQETGEVVPADADLWQRLRERMTELNLTGSLIKKITCFHEFEGYSSI